jgi:Tfp pilus assembly protein PilP
MTISRMIVVFGFTLLCASAADAQTKAPETQVPDSAGQMVLNREVFDYNAAGRRDPFLSLMTTSELKPLLTDLRLVGVLTDISGRNSVAILRDITSKEQYRVKVGQTLGRMRVTRIEPKSVVFTIEEFGFSRQETLVMGDSTQARIQ